MAFHFNPSLWFVCKLCRESFPDTDKLKAHKLESHLGESLHIKSIVFEEKLLDYELIPNSRFPQECNDDATNVHKAQMTLKSEQSKFKNPYVSLSILTAQKLNSTVATASGTKSIGGGTSRVGSACRFGFKGESGKLLAKRKLNSVSDTILLPSKLPKIADSVEDDARKNKIRELLRNAFTIKSKPGIGNRGLSPSTSSKIINPVNDVTFNSLLPQQQNQFQPQENPVSLMQNSLTTFNLSNSQFVPQILPAFVVKPEPEQNNSYPIILNDNEQRIQVQGGPGSDTLNSFDVTLPAGPATTFMTNAFNGKVEFVEYDSVVNEDVKIESTTEPNLSHLNHNLSLPLKSKSTFVLRLSDKKIGKRYICPICSATFGRNSHLTQHKIIHSNYRAFQCPECDSKFKTKSCLKSHSISAHGSISKFKCELCSKFFPKRREWLNHKASHNRVRPYQCDFPNCGTQLKSQSTLYVHRRLKHGKTLGLEQFECPTCGKTFGLRKFLKTHQKRAHQSPNVQILS